jgi:RNA-binding protein Musashi
MNLIQLQSHHLQHQPGPDQLGSLKLSMDQLTGLPLTSPNSGQGELGSQGESSGRSTPSSDSAPGKLFVGGLSWQTSQDKLREYFGQFGNVTDVLVMKDPITQRSRGFGFITFSTPEAVDRVLSVPSHSLDGKKIDPKHATPKSKSKANKTKKIFVGGVSQETSADEVKAYFNQFGKVEEAVMLMDQQTKRHRGFGFVTFEQEETVDRVCEIHFHTIKNKKVECKKAQPKEAVQAANTAALLGKRVILSNLGMIPGLSLPALTGPQHQLSPQQSLQSALQQQLAASAALGGYGKLIGAGSPGMSSHRYSPYSLPSFTSGAMAGLAGHPQLVHTTNGGMQYTMSSPLMSQPSSSQSQGQLTSSPGGLSTLDSSQQGTNLGSHPGMAMPGPYPGYNLANIPGVDWSSLGYSLPAMYTL